MRETPIQELLDAYDASVRLRNALLGPYQLPYKTVGEYLDAGPHAFQEVLRVRNLGMKSARELDAIVSNYVEANGLETVQSKESEQPQIAVEREVRDNLVGLFSELKFPQILLDQELSVRLENGLINSFPNDCAFSEILTDFPGFLADLIRRPNVGRKSALELRASVYSLFETCLRETGLGGSDVELARNLVFDRLPTEDRSLEGLAAYLEKASKFDQDDLNPVSDDLDTEALANSLLAELTDRQRDVIKRRWAIEHDSEETLEEIGVRYNVTRERIRQIESKAIKRLSNRATKRRLEIVLQRDFGKIWDAISHGMPFVVGARSASRESLSGQQRLAISIVSGSTAEWLTTNAVEWGRGWARPDIQLAQLIAIEQTFREALEGQPLPVSTSVLKESRFDDAECAAINLSESLILHEGYLIAGRATARKKRTIGLHHLLVWQGRLMETGRLLELYHDNYPDDRCSVRDIEICMAEATHLFARIPDSRWYGLGKTGPTASSPSNAPEENGFESPEGNVLDSGDDGIADALERIFELYGPQPMADITKHHFSELPPNVSESSIGPILLTSGRFVRFQYGTYGLPNQVPDPAQIIDDLPSYMRSETQVRYYAMGRAAGEPFGTFRLWTPESEYAWCRWAQHNVDSDVFCSLLAIAQPDDWPIKDEDREYWFNLKRTKGRYLLAANCKHALRELWPTLRSVFRACVAARYDERFSWISANRIIPKRINSHKSAGLLCLLVATGSLRNAHNWQAEHKPGVRIDEILSAAEKERCKTGQLDWNSDFGKWLLEQARQAQNVISGGWVNPDNLGELLSGYHEGSVTGEVANVDNDQELSELDVLLRELDEDQSRERLGGLLDTFKKAQDP